MSVHTRLVRNDEVMRESIKPIGGAVPLCMDAPLATIPA
jgi:hypothetical protein